MRINFRFLFLINGHLGVFMLHLCAKFYANILIQCEDVYILRNLTWPPSIVLDLWGEDVVVRPPAPAKIYLWLFPHTHAHTHTHTHVLY